MYMKQSSVITYYQAVRFFAKLFQLDTPLLSHPHLKAVLNGVLNNPGSASVPKAAFLVEDLRRLNAVICIKLDIHLLVWSAVLLMFRTLLRVSHVVDSPHCIKRGDVEKFDWGLIISIHSSKTRRFTSSPVRLPVVKGKVFQYCPVFWVSHLLENHSMGLSDPLFSTKKLPKLSYSLFSRTFKLLCSAAGLKRDYSSHSLRRGGATFMSNSGISVSEVKDRGGWASDVVYRYISPSSMARRTTDQKFSSFFDLGLLGE